MLIEAPRSLPGFFFIFRFEPKNLPLRLSVFIVFAAGFFMQTPPPVFSQWKLINSAEVGNVAALQTDKLGNVYIGLENGTVQQRDSLGNLYLSFFPDTPAFPLSIEAGLSVRIGVFYQEIQQFLWLSRRMALAEKVDLSEKEVGFVNQLAVSEDGAFWLWNQQRFQLQKLFPAGLQSLVFNPMDLQFPQRAMVMQLMEHQHHLFIGLKEKGVWILNSRGNILQKIPFPMQQDFRLMGNFLITSEKETLLCFDWMKNEKAGKVDLPTSAEKLCLSGNFLYLISKGKLMVFRGDFRQMIKPE